MPRQNMVEEYLGTGFTPDVEPPDPPEVQPTDRALLVEAMDDEFALATLADAALNSEPSLRLSTADLTFLDERDAFDEELAFGD